MSRQTIVDEATELYQGAVDTWGVVAQLLMAVEELGELQQAILHFLRGREHNGRGTKEQIAEEVADVTIMLDQIGHMIPGVRVAKHDIMCRKLERLKRRLIDDGWKEGDYGRRNSLDR